MPKKALLTGRNFGPRMAEALRLVAKRVPMRTAAQVVGLATHQDIARAALELGVGVRRNVTGRIGHSTDRDPGSTTPRGLKRTPHIISHGGAASTRRCFLDLRGANPGTPVDRSGWG